MITIDQINDYTDIYTESYMRALERTHNPDLAVQTAMGVLMTIRMVDNQAQPKQPEPQINPMAALFGAMIHGAAQNREAQGEDESDEDD